MKLPRLVAIALTLAAATSVAQAAVVTFTTFLVPEVSGATGSGYALVTFNDATNDLSFSRSFMGLSGTTTQANFHCCTATPRTGTAGIAVDSPTLPGFPLGVSAGTFGSTIDLDDATNFNGVYFAASGGTTALAITRLLNGFRDGTAYLNIHSTRFPGGEIRGFMSAPEPASMALVLVALAAMGSGQVRRKSTR